MPCQLHKVVSQAAREGSVRQGSNNDTNRVIGLQAFQAVGRGLGRRTRPMDSHDGPCTMIGKMITLSLARYMVFTADACTLGNQTRASEDSFHKKLLHR